MSFWWSKTWDADIQKALRQFAVPARAFTPEPRQDDDDVQLEAFAKWMFVIFGDLNMCTRTASITLSLKNGCVVRTCVSGQRCIIGSLMGLALPDESQASGHWTHFCPRDTFLSKLQFPNATLIWNGAVSTWVHLDIHWQHTAYSESANRTHEIFDRRALHDIVFTGDGEFVMYV